jgi:hypothetical protein
VSGSRRMREGGGDERRERRSSRERGIGEKGEGAM